MHDPSPLPPLHPITDVKQATYLANKFVLYYNFSDLGVTNFSRQPYSPDFAIGASRPRKVSCMRGQHSRSVGRAKSCPCPFCHHPVPLSQVFSIEA